MLSRLALAGLTVIAVSGCHSYYPYCNSCGSNPAMMPGQVYQPSQVYQPGTFAPGQIQQSVPANGGSGASQFRPPINSTPPDSNGGGNLVPNPDTDYDQNSDPSSGVDPGFGGENEETGAVEQPSGVALSHIDDEELEASDSSGEVANGEPAEDEFSPPIPFKPASSSRTISEASPPPKSNRPNPYLYDNKNDDSNGDGVAEAYEWLRGVVEYDEKLRQWRITYNPDPTDKTDKYQGTFTLSNDEAIYKSAVDSDDVILVDGRVDIENPDASGKPTYRVENVQRLKPVSGVASVGK